jgi:peptide deformylase
MSINILPFFYRKVPVNIVQYPDKRLTEEASPVKSFNAKTERIISELIKTIKKLDKPFNPWIGMSAPQLGYPNRIIVLKASHRKYLVMINPEVIDKKWKFATFSTCYSVRGLYLLPRYFWFKIKYQDIEENLHEIIIKGGKAIVLQQELEHLEGKLICD